MITEEQFKEAADIIGCQTSAIKAVYEVEAAGRGYLTNGKVKILFEGHIFWKQVIKHGGDPVKLVKDHPKYYNVLYPKWDRLQYKGGEREWERMTQAVEACGLMGLEPALALNSASYGSFQILGNNFSLCGYPDAQTMLTEYNLKGEAEQLNSFCRFVKSTHLDKFLINKDWDNFSKGYNGTAYLQNHYNTKLAAADKKYSQ